MKNKQGKLMTYSFACPYPCNRVIEVKARNFPDAIEKIVTAGAIGCRSSQNQFICENIHFEMSPIPEGHLKKIVGLCMQEECMA